MQKHLVAFGISLLLLPIGCSTKKKDEEPVPVLVPAPASPAFQADSTSLTLDDKYKSVAVTFTKKVGSIPEGKEGVIVSRMDGNKVIFTQTIKPPREEKHLEFIVKGEGPDENTTIRLALARRAPADVVLERQSVDLYLGNRLRPLVLALDVHSGDPEIESITEDKKGVSAQIVDEKLVIRVQKGTPAGMYLVALKSSAADRQGASLKVNVKEGVDPALARPADKAKDALVLDDDGKIVVMLQSKPREDTQIMVKARSGTITGVIGSSINPKVSWKFIPASNAIQITVAKDAGSSDARSYGFQVQGTSPSGSPARTEVHFKVVPPPAS